MATTPGILTDWPWKPLGSFKYVILAPWVGESIYKYVRNEEKDRDFTNFFIPLLLLSRVIHNQIWISLARYQTAKGKHRIVDKTIEFDQVDREKDWDDQIIFNGILFYWANKTLEGASHMPIWNTDGVIIVILLHTGAVEFLYYWFHRALHHHFLYSRYHSHHHSSVVTEPITSVIHPFAEHIVYFMLFGTPLLITVLTRTCSIVALAGYLTYIDLMNNMGHCNFEFIPHQLFSIFPPLKYLMYTPSVLSGLAVEPSLVGVRSRYYDQKAQSLDNVYEDEGPLLDGYHSLHHTQFRTNYSLFMPFYDYIYNTMDISTDSLYQTSLERQDDSVDVVHLTHLTTPESIYHLRVGFAHQASKPQTSNWYFWLLCPLTIWSMVITWIYGKTFVVERNVFKNLMLQTWAIPKYKQQYFMPSQREIINSMIEQAILEAEERGIKVLSLGLLNQGQKLNMSGEMFVRRNPQLKVKVVDGSSLAVAIVLNTIPKGTTIVALRGNFNKVASSIAMALSQKGIKVTIPDEDDFKKVTNENGDANEFANNFLLSNTCEHIKIWLVGDDLSEEDQQKVSKGTFFIPFTQFPPKKFRKDCFYHTTPAMLAPKFLQNVDSCENWLPRRVMSATRIAGILHALEGWDVNECGNNMFDVDRIWQASLLHGFHPLEI